MQDGPTYFNGLLNPNPNLKEEINSSMKLQHRLLFKRTNVVAMFIYQAVFNKGNSARRCHD